MKRFPVKSSSLAAVGYDPEFSTLEVEFRNSRSYRYFVVPTQVFEKLMAAESKGAFLNRHIKPRFPSSRVS
jgi:hypothetical protein